MEGKSQLEIRRKKNLENAEARLRFIKEGIPWRNNETVCEETSQTDGNSKAKDVPELAQEDTKFESQTASCTDEKCLSEKPEQDKPNNTFCKYNHYNPSSGLDSLGSSETFIKGEVDNLSRLSTETNSSESDNQSPSGIPGTSNPPFHPDEIDSGPKDTVNVIISNNVKVKTNCSEVDSNETEMETNDYNVISNDPPERIETNVNSIDNDSETNDIKVSNSRSNVPNIASTQHINLSSLLSNEPVRSLKALLMDSNNEREEQKRRCREINSNIWTSLLIMLCLGVVTRICYAVGLSWLFNGIMLVPFFTAAVPRLFPIILNPPAPSGPLFQFLLMVGVKLKLLRQVLTLVSIMRMFLQLFSVFLIAFVFTHQLIETLFA